MILGTSKHSSLKMSLAKPKKVEKVSPDPFLEKVFQPHKIQNSVVEDFIFRQQILNLLKFKNFQALETQRASQVNLESPDPSQGVIRRHWPTPVTHVEDFRNFNLMFALKLFLE
ncbi:hypothetical protein NPIL_594191 [Nephila pilipes]|uniref:Uncharacterized protein n=1 Tax=Nephila pilipes TaxID=299642 RepID=A0A8X6T863_NEPPI|nr:hypothetical protein NPIL_594191 [Nephila pilipes]